MLPRRHRPHALVVWRGLRLRNSPPLSPEPVEALDSLKDGVEQERRMKTRTWIVVVSVVVGVPVLGMVGKAIYDIKTSPTLDEVIAKERAATGTAPVNMPVLDGGWTSWGKPPAAVAASPCDAVGKHLAKLAVEEMKGSGMQLDEPTFYEAQVRLWTNACVEKKWRPETIECALKQLKPHDVTENCRI